MATTKSRKKADTLSDENKAKLQEALESAKTEESSLPMLDAMWADMTGAVSDDVAEAQVIAAELEAVVERRKNAYFVRALAFEAYRRAEADPEHPLAQLKEAHREALNAINNTIKVAGNIKIAKAPQGGEAFGKLDALRTQMEVIKLSMANYIAKQYSFSSYAEAEQLIAAENKLFNTKESE